VVTADDDHGLFRRRQLFENFFDDVHSRNSLPEYRL
jgi:hypothetical protein